MTIEEIDLEIDLERLCVALADAAKAADDLAAHAVPDWVAHRLATFKAEATSLDAALAEHQKEYKENQQ